MEPNHLKVFELDYEISIRGKTPIGDVDSKRRLLRGLLNRERHNRSLSSISDTYEFQKSVTEIRTSLKEIQESINSLVSELGSSSKRIETRLNHVSNRIERLDPDTPANELIKKQLEDEALMQEVTHSCDALLNTLPTSMNSSVTGNMDLVDGEVAEVDEIDRDVVIKRSEKFTTDLFSYGKTVITGDICENITAVTVSSLDTADGDYGSDNSIHPNYIPAEETISSSSSIASEDHQHQSVNHKEPEYENETDEVNTRGCVDVSFTLSPQTERVLDNESIPTFDITKATGRYTRRYFCIYCKKLFAKLPKHLEHCHANEVTVESFIKLPAGDKGALLKAKSVYQYLHPKVCYNLVHRVFPILRECSAVTVMEYDELGICVMNDMCRIYTDQHFDDMIRAKIRLMGRLLLTAREFDSTISDLASLMDPSKFDLIVQVINNVAGLNSKGTHYRAPVATS
ncbi:hypothetical protein RN001_005840 [Aquatica leii]|uniref:Uncharacterized protein n=1 Tax=Aquatica leii TaxID=1421715 RepID=A0AAN7PHK9_9COLE|nr:hypothetical protein RN001_005840 [Aquatica leii]